MNFSSAVMGLELGSTRIKAVLIDEDHQVIAQGSHEWENTLKDGVWTYPMEEVFAGIRACYKDLKDNVKKQYGETLTTVGAIGISGMMHGYLPFDKEGNQLAEFRTWRNTMTGEAAEKLTKVFGFNIPQRWSIAHLYQAVLKGESHVKDIAFLTTLAGYVHYKLSGRKVMGIGEASGMFPIDSAALTYDQKMMEAFDKLPEIGRMPWKLSQILPEVLPAGANAGCLTEEGAKLLDEEGDLMAGIPMAPCEGDAGTGMAATNSVRVRTGNVSAGTSDFAMLVTEKMPGVHREIDMVTTPAGRPVAMVHCNNCTSDINAWVSLFSEFADLMGMKIDKGELFTKLFRSALTSEGAEADAGGLLSYNYISGEGVTDLDDGRPVFTRVPGASFTLKNFMRTHLLSAMATLKIGLDILTGEEKVTVDKLYGHGGFFKTPEIGQRILSAAVKAPVSCMETAGEGGPYGMALLAGYMVRKEEAETLEDYLDHKVFKDAKGTTLIADPEEIDGFDKFLALYKKAMDVEKKAIETVN